MANPAYTALKAAIRAKTPGRLYFFYGEEVFLLRHYRAALKKLLIDPVTEAFNYHTFTPENFRVSDFAEAVDNLPMMAQRTMVCVDEIDLFRLPEDDRARAAATLGDIPDYCTVVFTYITTPWKIDKRQKKLCDAIGKNGAVVEFEKQDARELIPWITRHFAALGKRISPELCAYLIDISGGTMTALSGEIDKIAAYSGAETIVRQDIDAVVEPVLDAKVFQMTDRIGQGNYAAALLTLRQLLQMQQEPLAILGALGSYFRRLSAAQTLLSCGKGLTDIMRLCGIGEYPARKAMAAAQRFSPAVCEKAAALVLETDIKMKTSFDDQTRLLETLLLQLIWEVQNG